MGRSRGQFRFPWASPSKNSPPQQHRSQGGGPGGQAVVVGVGDGARLVRGVGGEPEQGRHDGRVRQGPQVYGQSLPAPGGQGDLSLALVGRLRRLTDGGVPQLRPVQKDGGVQPGGLEDQERSVRPALRQGQGVAVPLPLLQLRRENGGVKGRLRPAGSHHRPRLPGGVEKGALRLGKSLEEGQRSGAHRQESEGV